MPQAYFIREAYFTLRSNISLVPQGTNFIEKDDCFRNRLFLPKSDQKVRKYSEERLKVHHSYCSINLNLIIQQ